MDKIIYTGSVGVPASMGKKAKASVTGNGEGVYTIRVNDDMTLDVIQVSYADNAGIICISENGKFVYAANESKDFGGLNGSGGGVTAYRIDEQTGKLIYLNQSVSYGSRTSHVCVTENNRYLIASNHGSHTTVTCHYVQNENGDWILKRGFDDSSVAVFRLNDNGSIDRLTDLKIFDGSGYWCHGGGQSTSHIHCVKTRNDLVFACNRGTDEIEVLKIDQKTGKLEILQRNHVRSGYAPRHMIFHPDKNIFYVCNENYPSVSAYEYDETTGIIKEIQICETMPADYYAERPLPHFDKFHADPDEINTCGFADRGAAMPSDIHINRKGTFLYVSNRWYSVNGNIAVFHIGDNSMMTLSGHIQLTGKDPRGFGLTNDGEYLFAGTIDNSLVEIFRLDHTNGLAVEKISANSVPSPASFVINCF